VKNGHETGFFMPMEDTGVKIMIAPSQGAHLVVPKTFLQCVSTIMVGQTSGGRVPFISAALLW
jgi:glycerol-3-phosphate dehydrogenase